MFGPGLNLLRAGGEWELGGILGLCKLSGRGRLQNMGYIGEACVLSCSCLRKGQVLLNM